MHKLHLLCLQQTRVPVRTALALPLLNAQLTGQANVCRATMATIYKWMTLVLVRFLIVKGVAQLTY